MCDGVDRVIAPVKMKAETHWWCVSGAVVEPPGGGGWEEAYMVNLYLLVMQGDTNSCMILGNDSSELTDTPKVGEDV